MHYDCMHARTQYLLFYMLDA
eukprot:COSAG01_NODE_52457_length_346_cov_1.417004_1_plen_20_part_10